MGSCVKSDVIQCLSDTFKRGAKSGNVFWLVIIGCVVMEGRLCTFIHCDIDRFSGLLVKDTLLLVFVCVSEFVVVEGTASTLVHWGKRV